MNLKHRFSLGVMVAMAIGAVGVAQDKATQTAAVNMKDPRVGFTTVMDVRTSPDLRHARVYVSVLGDEEDKQETVGVLQRARGYLRARLGRDITLKYLPELHFELDRTLEQAARISAGVGYDRRSHHPLEPDRRA